SLDQRAAADPGWRGLAALDASIRKIEGQPAGPGQGEKLSATFACAFEKKCEGTEPVPPALWWVQPAPNGEQGDAHVRVRGGAPRGRAARAAASARPPRRAAAGGAGARRPHRPGPPAGPAAAPGGGGRDGAERGGRDWWGGGGGASPPPLKVAAWALQRVR